MQTNLIRVFSFGFSCEDFELDASTTTLSVASALCLASFSHHLSLID